jgi:uncharacterized protein (DUF433 family)
LPAESRNRKLTHYKISPTFHQKQVRYCLGETSMPLDWSQCSAVESVPGKMSGAWVFRGTRMPVATVFENLEDGLTIDEIIEQLDVTRQQVTAVLEFAARSLAVPSPR